MHPEDTGSEPPKRVPVNTLKKTVQKKSFSRVVFEQKIKKFVQPKNSHGFYENSLREQLNSLPDTISNDFKIACHKIERGWTRVSIKITLADTVIVDNITDDFYAPRGREALCRISLLKLADRDSPLKEYFMVPKKQKSKSKQ